MPSPRFRRSPAPLGATLFLLGLIAVALAAWTWASGGFRVTVWRTTLSVRAAWPAALAGLTCWAALVAWRRAGARDDAEALAAGMARVESALAGLVCGAVLVAGVAWGSTVAGGADSSGYLSQAALWRRGELVVTEAAIPRDGALSAWNFTPLGFRPGAIPGTIVPSYPPGLPLQFAFASLFGERALALVVPLLGALAVWCTFLLGRGHAGPAAGLAAAVLLASSPVFLYQLVQPMSDVPVTAWWLAAFASLALGARHGAITAGLASGMALLTRPNLVALLPCLLVLAGATSPTGGASPPALRSRVRRVAVVCAGVAPFLLILAWFNDTLYGAPWASGYGDAGQLFSVKHVEANLRRYGAWLVDVQGPLLVLAPVGFVAAFRSRAPHRGPTRFASVTLFAVVCVSYLAYFPFESWTYLRFLLPAIAGLAVTASATLILSPVLLPRWATVVVGTLALALVAGQGMGLARTRGLLELASREARYDRVAVWVRDHTSGETLVLCSQHSGSIHHTAGRRVLRWDLATPGELRAAADVGRSAPSSSSVAPMLIVLDADEEPAFRSRHGAVTEVGQLDWPPRAATPPPSQARVYRVEDAEAYRQGRASATELLSLPR